MQSSGVFCADRIGSLMLWNKLRCVILSLSLSLFLQCVPDCPFNYFKAELEVAGRLLASVTVLIDLLYSALEHDTVVNI